MDTITKILFRLVVAYSVLAVPAVAVVLNQRRDRGDWEDDFSPALA